MSELRPTTYERIAKRQQRNARKLARERQNSLSSVAPTANFRAFDAPSYAPDGVYQGIGINANQQKLMQEVLGVAAISTRKIAERIMSLELQTVTGNPEKPEVVEDHPMLDPFRNPNALHKKRQLFYLAASYIVTVGETYLLMLQDRAINQVREFNHLLPDRTFPIVSKGDIVGYQTRSQEGAETNYRKDEVVRAWYPDPITLYGPEGFIGKNSIEADASKFANEAVRSFFERDATPRTVIESREDTVGAPEGGARKRFEEQWMAAYNRRLGYRIGLPAFLPPGFMARVLSDGALSADSVEALAFYRDHMYAVFGVSRTIVGNLEDANRSNMESAQFGFDQFTIKPITDLIMEAINTQYVNVHFPGENIWIRFKPFISRDKDFELKREEQDLKLKILSINEVRPERNLPPADWGDDPVGNLSEVPYRPDEPMFPSVNPNPIPQNNEVETRSISSPIEAEWFRVLSREKKWATPMQAALRSILDAQHRALQREFKLIGVGSKANEPRAEDIAAAIVRTLNPNRWVNFYNARVERLRRQIMFETGSEMLTSLREDITITPELNFAMQSMARILRESMSQTTARKVSGNVLATWFDTEGQAITASERADGVYAELSASIQTRQNQMLAVSRAEVIRAAELGKEQAYRESGTVQLKQWNTAQDERVRDSHAAAHGQRVPINDEFTLGSGLTARYPGDPTLPLGETMNCRCFTTAVQVKGQ